MSSNNQHTVITHINRCVRVLLAFTAVFGLAVSGHAVDIVNDTWLDGERAYPASPTYSENGTDSDFDGNLESAWFVGGAGGYVTTTGQLQMTNGATSSSYTTYFTPDGSELTLSNPGDSLKVTWVFKPQGVNTSNTSQGFTLALVNTPGANRVVSDASPGTAVYAGYAMYMNMGQTLKNGNPFQLREWNQGATPGALLSSSGNWDALANGATSGNTGYISGTQYTFTMTLTLNGLGGIDIVSTMAGGSINGTGSMTDTFTDANGNGFAFDTFAIRPSAAASTAATFDTTLFKVEYTAVPEPSTFALAGAGLGLMIALIRRRRR